MAVVNNKVILSVAVTLFLLFSTYRLVWRQYFGEQECEMTYMYEWPQYQRIVMASDVERKYPQYSLHLYKEGTPLPDIANPSVRGVPVLFVPGNAGSYKQGRSSGSIALRMHSHEFPRKTHFDVFTVNLNEELSGMFGGVLQRQTDYVTICIDKILSLYKRSKPRPKSVVIIGHSMGGVVAKGLFVEPGFDEDRVSVIVALSSPLAAPVVSFDGLLHDYYNQVHKVWSDPTRNLSSKVTVVSVSGGERDVMVPAHLSATPSSPVAMASPAVTRNWASADHLAIVWCRRLQLALTRSLFVLQDREGGVAGLTGDLPRREAVFRHFLTRGHVVPFSSSNTLNIKRKRMRVLEGSDHTLTEKDFTSLLSYAAFPLLEDGSSSHLVVASNTGSTSWLYVCSGFEDSQELVSCTDLSSLGHVLPPKDQVVKYVVLDGGEMDGRGHEERKGQAYIVVRSPAVSKNNGFVVVQQCQQQLSLASLHLPWLKSKMSLPGGHCRLMNVSLPGFGRMWHSYVVTATSHCGGVAGGVVTPWYPHHAFKHHINELPGPSSVTFHLSVLATPTSTPHGQPHLVLWSSPECELELEVGVAPLLLLDKLVLLYAPYLLPWLAAACMTTSCRCLHWELLAIASLCLASRFGWVDPGSLFGARPLWTGAGPVLLHLVSCSMQHLLSCAVVAVTDLASLLCSFRCLSRCRCRDAISWWLVLVGGASSVGLCSGLGFLLAFLGVLVRVRGRDPLSRMLVEASCVLLCLQVLLLPTLVSWAKGIGSALRLNPDPHVATSTLAILLIVILLYVTPTTATGPAATPTATSAISSPTEASGVDKKKKGVKALYVRGVYFSLGAAVAMGCMDAFRVAGPVLLYLLVTVLLLCASKF